MYEANTSVLNANKKMLDKDLEIGRGIRENRNMKIQPMLHTQPFGAIQSIGAPKLLKHR